MNLVKQRRYTYKTSIAIEDVFPLYGYLNRAKLRTTPLLLDD